MGRGDHEWVLIQDAKRHCKFLPDFSCTSAISPRRACPGQLWISEWDTRATGLTLIRSLQQSCRNWPIDTWVGTISVVLVSHYDQGRGLSVMQQHHSISWLIWEGNCHSLRTHSLSSTMHTNSFNLQNFWALLMLPSFMTHLPREGKDPQLRSGWARNSNSHVPLYKYSDYFTALSYLPAFCTTVCSNIRNNFALLWSALQFDAFLCTFFHQ